MYRRRSRRAYSNLFQGRNQLVGKRNKYSTITFAGYNVAAVDAGKSTFFGILAPTDVQGKRKIKNIMVNFSCANGDNNTILYWALVFVPSGTQPGALNLSGQGEFYVPSAYVMANGIYDVAQPGNATRIFTPLSRNLNSGDGIALVITSVTALAAQDFKFTGNYAITLN